MTKRFAHPRRSQVVLVGCCNLLNKGSISHKMWVLILGQSKVVGKAHSMPSLIHHLLLSLGTLQDWGNLSDRLLLNFLLALLSFLFFTGQCLASIHRNRQIHIIELWFDIWQHSWIVSFLQYRPRTLILLMVSKARSIESWSWFHLIVNTEIREEALRSLIEGVLIRIRIPNLKTHPLIEGLVCWTQ